MRTGAALVPTASASATSPAMQDETLRLSVAVFKAKQEVWLVYGTKNLKAWKSRSDVHRRSSSERSVAFRDSAHGIVCDIGEALTRPAPCPDLELEGASVRGTHHTDNRREGVSGLAGSHYCAALREMLKEI